MTAVDTQLRDLAFHTLMDGLGAQIAAVKLLAKPDSVYAGLVLLGGIWRREPGLRAGNQALLQALIADPSTPAAAQGLAMELQAELFTA